MTHRTFQKHLLRFAIVACLVAAAANVGFRAGGSGASAVAVVDVSRSMGTDIPTLPAGLRVHTRWIVVADGTREVVGGTEAPRLARTASRIGQALRTAAESYPGRNVLLLTDGRATDGDAVRGAGAVRAAGGRVFVMGPAAPAADVALVEARVTGQGGTVRVRTVITSSTTGRAVVSLVRADEVIARSALAVAPGIRRVVELTDPAPPPEGGAYQVVLAPGAGTPDDDPGNNRLALGWRSEVRSVLLVGVPDPTELALPPGLHVRSAPRLTPGLAAAADLVVVADLPWSRLAAGAADLTRFVRGGGRLLMLGGPSAYRPGGWTGTPIERELSALTSDPDDGPGLAMLLLVDRSGSTADRALAYLKAASRAATLRAVPGERVGVLPFAGAPDERLLAPGFVSAGDADERDQLIASLDGLQASGRTDIPKAVASGIDRLRDAEAGSRWLVLLTDGDPDGTLRAGDLAPLRAALDEAGVELAALVVGDAEAADALRAGLAARPTDVMLLEDADEFATRLEELVRKRRLRTDELPAPTRLETLREATLPLDVTKLGPRRLHDLEPSDGASVIVRATWDAGPRASAPFLARRDVGTGVVWSFAWGPAFATGLEARRSAMQELGRMVRTLAGESDRGLAAAQVGDDLVVRLPAAAGRGSITVTGEGEEPLALVLVEEAPGVFRGPMPATPDAGLAVRDSAGRLRALRLPARPGPEHRGAGIDPAAMARIAEAGGGRVLRPGEPAPKGGRAPRTPLAPWLLGLAAILLVLERLRSRADSGGVEPPAEDR